MFPATSPLLPDPRLVQCASVDPEIDFEGMTTNERLYSAGVIELWDRARAAGDRPEMIRLLMRVGFSKLSAESMTNSIAGRDQQQRDQKPL